MSDVPDSGSEDPDRPISDADDLDVEAPAGPGDDGGSGLPAPARTRGPLLIGVVVVVVLGVVIALATGIVGGAPSATDPIPDTADSVARGMQIYANSCAQCHGADARGGGPLAGTTSIPPPALTGPSSHLTVHSDQDLFNFIHDGLPGGMPSWAGTLTDNQIWDVINFLHSLGGASS